MVVAWVAVEGPGVDEVAPEAAEAVVEEAVEVVLIVAWVAVTETGNAPTRHVATTTFHGVFSVTDVQPHAMVLAGLEVPIMGHQGCGVA